MGALETPLRRLLPEPGTTTVGEIVAGFDPAAAAPADRPYLFTNFALTIDGHATIEGRSGSDRIRRRHGHAGRAADARRRGDDRRRDPSRRGLRADHPRPREAGAARAGRPLARAAHGARQRAARDPLDCAALHRGRRRGADLHRRRRRAARDHDSGRRRPPPRRRRSRRRAPHPPRRARRPRAALRGRPDPPRLPARRRPRRRALRHPGAAARRRRRPRASSSTSKRASATSSSSRSASPAASSTPATGSAEREPQGARSTYAQVDGDGRAG